MRVRSTGDSFNVVVKLAGEEDVVVCVSNKIKQTGSIHEKQIIVGQCDQEKMTSRYQDEINILPLLTSVLHL